MLDGKWGTGSQSALEKYTFANYDTVPLNLHVTTLLMDYLNSFEIWVWRTRFLPDIGISLILPDKTMIQRERENGFYRWDTVDNSLSVVK